MNICLFCPKKSERRKKHQQQQSSPYDRRFHPKRLLGIILFSSLDRIELSKWHYCPRSADPTYDFRCAPSWGLLEFWSDSQKCIAEDRLTCDKKETFCTFVTICSNFAAWMIFVDALSSLFPFAGSIIGVGKIYWEIGKLYSSADFALQPKIKLWYLEIKMFK